MHAHSKHTGLKEWFKFTYKHNNKSWIRIPTRPEKIKVIKILSYKKKTGNALFGNCYRTERTSVKVTEFECVLCINVCVYSNELTPTRCSN